MMVKQFTIWLSALILGINNSYGRRFDLKCVTSCTSSDVDSVARVVFGESRGEAYRGQLAVAYSVVNRVKHQAYPNTIQDVLSATWGNGKHHEYETLDLPGHDMAWVKAKRENNDEYLYALIAAKEAICACAADPTRCAVSFCAGNGCIKDNQWYIATNRMTIGNHHFACRVPANG
ncbi:SLEB-like protein [Mya arenaria]|uniref:SLEB-like protein n=1 Tax=Mya arenaria TaxID=6604 RepID=A0ABY7EJV9_MYAAR|nr:uncharacterized protein LOC128239907 [Mya arenaria]WAR10155.1 SLEB-like protein [Mya arenaria]